MSAAPARSFTRIAIAVVIAAVVILAATLSYASFESTVTRTSISTTTSTLTSVSTTTLTTATIVLEPDQTSSISTTTCTYTGFEVVACSQVYNETYAYSINYTGPWGASYQVWNSPGDSGTPYQSGSFYGHEPTDVMVSFTLYSTGFEVCINAQKLDASSSPLILTYQGGEENSTSLAYGTASLCAITEQV